MIQRPPDPRTTRTRAAILDATSELLATSAGAAVSVAQIAKRAGVSVGSVYLHFESKDELVAQVIRLAWARRSEQFAAVRGEPTPVARVLAFGDALLDFAREEPVAFRALRVRAMEPPVASDMTEQTVLHEPLDALEADLAEAMDRGDIARQSADAAVVVLFGLWTGIAEQVVRRDGLAIDADGIEAVRQLARAIVLGGLRTPALAGIEG